MDQTTYEFLQPSEDQKARMAEVRAAARALGDVMERNIPSGPDKTFAFRQFRTAMMWCNVAITRQADGSPRAGKDDQDSGQGTA
jgi:hypothetical protein